MLSMDISSLSPSHIDDVIASKIPLLKPTVEADTIPEFSPSLSDSIMPPKTVIEAAPKTVTEARSEEGGAKEKPAKSKNETWDPDPFFRDASWFRTHCKLPDVGEIPLKISNVSEQMLKDYFGEKNRNGYKLSLYTGIPMADLLALSQVADGYEKPVNGMISHSFAKGAYVERILKRKVNWASYASTKLKGQVLQIHREQKPKPDGPSWVRRLQVYSAPAGEDPENKVSSATGKGKAPTDFNGGESSPKAEKTVEVDRSATMQQHSDPAGRHDAWSNPMKESSSPELLKLICDQVLKAKASLSKVAADRQKVQAMIAKLGEEELGNTQTVNALTKEIGRLDLEVVKLLRKLALEEDLVGEATTDIELESNKEIEGDDPDKIGGQLLTMMMEKLATHEAAVRNWQSLISRAKSTLSSTKDQLQRARKKHEKLPGIVKKLTALSTALEGERVKLNDLTYETKIVRLTLSKPCTPLSPMYVLGSVGWEGGGSQNEISYSREVIEGQKYFMNNI